ncbi:hypothetical protein ACSBR1_013810 [Camellia fascicularis]
MNQLRLPKVVGMGQVLWVFFKSVLKNLHLLPLHHQLGFLGFRALRRCQWRRKSIWTRCSSARTTVTSGTLISWAPFRSTLHLAEASKAQFSRDYSDHFALVRAYKDWKEAERGVARYEYCWKNFISAQSMKAIDTLQREFYSAFKEYVLNFNARWL